MGALRSSLSMNDCLLKEPSAPRLQLLDHSILSDVPWWSLKAHLEHVGLTLKEVTLHKRVIATTNEHLLSTVESLLGVISQKLKN